MKKLSILLCTVAMLSGCSSLHMQQQQKKFTQICAEWRVQSYQRRQQNRLTAYRTWQQSLSCITAAELVHRAPTEENPTPTIIVKLSTAEVTELIDLLSKGQPGKLPEMNQLIKPGDEPFELTANGDIIPAYKLPHDYAPIDYREDFFHLYDADGNEIVPELSPWEDDICGTATPRTNAFVQLPDEELNRLHALPSYRKFKASVEALKK